MAKDINLSSQEWLNLVFEGKNKEYGAYVLRDESSNRHIQALLIVIMVCLALLFIPKAIRSVVPQPAPPPVKEKGVVTLLDAPEKTVEMPVVEIKTPPLSVMEALRPTIKLAPPRIVEDNRVNPENIIETQQGITDSGREVSGVTQEGVKGGTLDPAQVPHTAIEPVAPEPVIETWVDQPPVFDNVRQWLSRQIKYPAVAIERGIQGQVVLRFVVGTDGSVSNVTVVKSLDPSCDREAVRVVKSMPNWIPGRKNGELVPVYFTLPVTFKLQ